MCPPVDYYTTVRESKAPEYHRLRLVQAARAHGVKPAAKLFATTTQTTRKWCRRFDGTLASLRDRSRAPHRRPRRLPPEAEAAILRAKQKLRPFGARRLKLFFGLPYSVKAIQRVCREHGLQRRWRRKKHETKRCLRQLKRRWRLWQQITIDTKDLCDLPEYWLQTRAQGLPRYQYTAREVSTGVLFLAFADELALAYAELFAQRILAHLTRHGVCLARVTAQTDNGSEFVGSWQATGPSAFSRALTAAGASHRRIPPGQHRWQADVETVHSLMEYEFYLERFAGRQDFLAATTDYQHFFNYLRPNQGKEHKSPWQLIREEKDSTAPLSLLYLPPVFLEDLLDARLHPRPGGNDVWGLPCFGGSARGAAKS